MLSLLKTWSAHKQLMHARCLIYTPSLLIFETLQLNLLPLPFPLATLCCPHSGPRTIHLVRTDCLDGGGGEGGADGGEGGALGDSLKRKWEISDSGCKMLSKMLFRQNSQSQGTRGGCVLAFYGPPGLKVILQSRAACDDGNSFTAPCGSSSSPECDVKWGNPE